MTDTDLEEDLDLLFQPLLPGQEEDPGVDLLEEKGLDHQIEIEWEEEGVGLVADHRLHRTRKTKTQEEQYQSFFLIAPNQLPKT